MCENPHVDMNRPAVAELMADVSAALARRVNALCEDICEVTLREIPQLNGRHAARLDRWIAVIRLQRSAVRAARVVWLLDARTVRWSGGLPPRDLSRGATGLSAEETPILWFRAGDGDGADGPRVFTVSGVFGAAGVLDAARVRMAARRMRRQVRLRMAVDPQMWGLSAGPAAHAGTWAGPGPVLRIIAAGTPRPLEAEAIRPWM